MTRLIVALDTRDHLWAKNMVEELGAAVGFYKVGLELFTAAGPELVQWLKSAGKKVFLDLKFHDIPNTAGRAVAAASALGVDLCTVHVSGGKEMLQACRQNAGHMKLLGVTVLTSSDESTLRECGIEHSVARQVQQLASLAVDARLNGIICAASDLAQLQGLPSDFLRVTPGIRPAGSVANDQKRVMTPSQAAKNGATHIVVGRPITTAQHPRQAAAAIINQLEECK